MNILALDTEYNGPNSVHQFHQGQHFAVGACVVSPEGAILEEIVLRCPIVGEVKEEVKSLILPAMEGIPVNCEDNEALNTKFLEFWNQYFPNSLACAFYKPMEMSFLRKIGAPLGPFEEGAHTDVNEGVCDIQFKGPNTQDMNELEAMVKEQYPEILGTIHNPLYDAKITGLGAYIVMQRLLGDGPSLIDPFFEKILLEHIKNKYPNSAHVPRWSVAQLQ